MSPKIWTLIAGASLGLLVSASACTVTSSDDGGDNDDGGASAGVGGNGTGGSTTSTGGTGGTGVGGGGTCVGCADLIHANGTDGTDPLCGTNPDDTCEPGSACEQFVDLYLCACGDGTTAGDCAAACDVDGMDLCSTDTYIPISDDCINCLTASGACSGVYGNCI